MSEVELSRKKVRHLHYLLADRVFAVPKLQREFVWNGPRAAELLDSIHRAMPIGSLLVWETGPSHYDHLRRNLTLLPPFDPKRPWGLFIIDGQQRLSVLHEILAGQVRSNSLGQEVDFGRVCFDLSPDADEDGGMPRRFVYRKPVEKRFVPVCDILAPNWRRLLRNHTQKELARLDDCRQRLREYEVPLVVVRSRNVDEIRDIFIRINTQGMGLRGADRVFARASAMDLRDMAHELRSGINRDFQNIDLEVILQGFAFVTRERELDVGARPLEATIAWWNRQIDHEGKQALFLDRWKRYRIAFEKAVDLLCSKFHVYESKLLPSTNMVATLAVFFMNYRRSAPTTRQGQEIRRWFWATGVGQRYSGRGFRQNLMKDVEFFERLGRSGNARFRFDDLADASDVARSEYGKPSAINAAFYCLLLAHGPRFIENGEAIRYDQDKGRANRGDRHHIFPRQLLATNGLHYREYNSICNICLVAAEENQRFGMRHPRSYLDEYRRRTHFKRTMVSHLIPYDEESGLWTKGARQGYLQFRRRRLTLVCREFEAAAGMRLFRKRSDVG